MTYSFFFLVIMASGNGASTRALATVPMFSEKVCEESRLKVIGELDLKAICIKGA